MTKNIMIIDRHGSSALMRGVADEDVEEAKEKLRKIAREDGFKKPWYIRVKRVA